MPGPLSNIRIIELASIGPIPFTGMMLADHGAEVIRIDRPGGVQAGIGRDATKDILGRSRKSVVVDLKKPEGIQVVRDLARVSAGLIEGFRPGVMERLGLAPEILHAENPRLVYGRMTGWGQTGPYAQAPGHDINYIALSGNLHGYGRAGDKPTPPSNMIGDYGGGGMLLAFGMVSAILNARSTGRGQVIDCAMVDGAAVLSSLIWSLRAVGRWRDERGVNLLDTGSHFYDSYETADGKYVAIGSVEPRFYAELRRLTGLEQDRDFDRQMDASAWPKLKEKLARLFKTKTRDEWCAVMETSDVCFAPVLTMEEAPHHPHNVARGTFTVVDGITQPAPAPRFLATPSSPPVMPRADGSDTDSVLAAIGYDERRISDLRTRGVLASGPGN